MASNNAPPTASVPNSTEEYSQPPPYSETMASNPPKAYEAPPPPPPIWGTNPPPPPPPGWNGYPTSYGTVTVQPVPVPVAEVILVGGCPRCRVGVLVDDFSCLGILCAILFFPLGLICCLACRDQRCTNCGARF